MNLPLRCIVTAVFGLLLVPLIAGQTCVHPQFGCYDYEERAQSAQDCTDLGGEPYPDQNPSEIADCELGCCCAEGDISPDPITRVLCSFQNETSSQFAGEYRFIPATARSCEQLCREPTTNETEPTPDDRFSVGGVVIDQNGEPIRNASVFALIPYGSLSDITNREGRFRIDDVPGGEDVTIHAARRDCAWNRTTLPLLANDRDDLIIRLACTAGVCVHETPIITRVSAVPQQPRNQIHWSMRDACGDLERFVVRRCEDGFEQGCVEFLPDPPRTLSFIDPPPGYGELASGTTYCYSIIAHFRDGTTTMSNPDNAACIDIGDPLCLAPHLAEFCDENARKQCNDRNAITTIEDCGSERVCTYTDDAFSELTECRPQAPCDKCNALYGLFAYLNLEIPFEGITTLCNALDESCYLDTTRTITDAQHQCIAVTSCYDYTSPATCADDPCDKIPAGCTWHAPSGGFEELGKGVCRPNEVDQERCDLCDDLFGTCSQTLCGSLGDCYYDADDNGLYPFEPTCRHRREMACRYYDTEADCINATGLESSVRVNITYDAQGDAVSGDHAVLRTSDDLFNMGARSEGFGLCQWVEGFGPERCISNADANVDPENPEDDCIEAGIHRNARLYPDCLRDTTPPSTNLILKQSKVYGLHELGNLTYYISDDLYPKSAIRTWFCLAEQGGEPCYPDTPIGGFALDDSDEGEWDLYYYSKDPSGNLEPIQKASIIIKDFNYPYIVGVEIE